ncbi:hypothetical protein DIT68_03655 [Brumimicrobium oceani]|uniref:Uncharacterized protein n=2 Tax=Brumimicrobium oceani TaxID=2100725 RepID=A0A2U2XEW3_9FLAO|nr:hypothetical protein DIT68_03655 [Brumimicrobium oceani]
MSFLDYSNIVVGGMIFQIGTGVYALIGGFKKEYLTPLGKNFLRLNYALFLFLAVVTIFDIRFFMNGFVYIPTGAVVSLLTILLLFFKPQYLKR